PTAEDPSGTSGSIGPRRFFDFNSGNVGGTGATNALSLMLVEGKLTTTQSDIHGSADPTIGPNETSARRGSVASVIGTYANAGFRVIASEEAFLGPGQRGGAFMQQSSPTLFLHRYSKQRGGAFVAMLFD